MAFLSFQHVTCERGGRRVLEDLSFDLETDETLVLLGRSGSGKTTAIRLITGLLDYRSGTVLFEGKDLRTLDRIELRRRIGYVIQDVGLLPHWTIAHNVAMVPQLQGWPEDRIRARVAELLEQVQLPGAQFGSRYPHELSGGQRQRVGFARALAANPALLLFDEPFGALDPITRSDMQRVFLALRKQYRVPALFVTHDVSEALRLGTRIAVLEGGRMETIAPRDSFAQSETPIARALLDTLSRPGELMGGGAA